ncbi:MAG: NAD(P)H-hydrate epimerase [Pirellulaceae bacterium]|nr:NAD(P)H-hydrate epimerase [Pirellulaceae bacterium]
MTLRTLTRDQVRRLDHLAMTEYGMSGLVLMENAGRGTTDVLCRLGISGPVVICCGRGNNAGDGFVIARHLDLRGHAARVLLWADPATLTGDAAANFAILRTTDVPIDVFAKEHDPARFEAHLSGAAWIVDALLGTGAQGEPRPPLDGVIDQINGAVAPKLAVDLPSGLDCDTGKPASHTVRAAHTCTFAAIKPGLLAPQAKPYVGELHLVDIGTPRLLLERMLGLEPRMNADECG